MVAVELPPEVVAGFVAEARSYLPAIRQSLESVSNVAKLDEAYRYAHTIKSSAAMMGHVALSQIAELLEGDLEGFQLGEPARPTHVAQLGRSLDRIAQLLDAAAGETVDIDAIIAAEVADRTAGDDNDGVEDAVEVPAAFVSAAEDLDAGEQLAVATVIDEPAQAEDVQTADEIESTGPAAVIETSADRAADGGLDADPDDRAGANPIDHVVECHPEQGERSEPHAHAPLPSRQTASLRHAERSEKSAREYEASTQDDKAPAQEGEPAAVEPGRACADALTPLLNELAESVLTLSRDVDAGRADLFSHRDALAAWLRRFETAADLPQSDPLPPIQVAAASRRAVVELDPAAEAEETLRRVVEAELRFQIEEEVRARVALETARATQSHAGVRLNLRSPGRSLTSAPAAAPSPGVNPAGDSSPPDGIEIDAETREVFALEAAEHLKRIDADAAALAANPADGAACAALRRSVHTLKGAAAMMGFKAIASLAHSLEDRLDAAVAAGTSDAASMGGVLEDLDRLEALIQRTLSGEPAAAPAPEQAADAQTLPLVAALPAESPTVTSVPVRLDHLDDLLRVAGETSVTVAAWPALLSGANQALIDLRRTVARAQSIVADLDERRLRGADPLLARPATSVAQSDAATASGTEQSGFDPLELDRYTAVDYLLHDLAEIATDAHSAERELASIVDSAGELVTGLRHQAGEMQERLLAARLVPLEELAGRLSRAALGVAAKREKQIDFTFTGGDVVVDRAILDSVADALIHLVRNASDHGIESPAARRAQGKPETGTLHVLARQEEGEVVVEVSDDGHGIDPARMGDAARAAGLDPERLTLDQAVDLIFRPGISTAGTVDDVSGRGVGLDAVRAAIERVRGSIEVVTEPGQGTIFALRFPVTLAQVRVVMVDVAGSPLAVPAANVKRVARLVEVSTERREGQAVVLHDGDAYPVADLSAALGLPGDAALPADPPVLFVEAAGSRAALLAGDVGTQSEVVVKPLGSHLRSLRGVSGATLLQDGRVALVLHLPDVLAEIGASSRPSVLHPVARGDARQSRSARRGGSDALRVLVVDDSPTIRKLLIRTLKDLGWRPEEAKDGVEALERIRVSRPDVVLADVEMPHLDGYGLLAALRGKAETADLPVVMLTSRTAERHRQRAAELGANGYLTKPYRPADVAAAVRRFARAAEAVA